MCKTAQTRGAPPFTLAGRTMFRLITTVRQGTACQLPAAWAQYPDIDAARAAVATLLRDERVQRVMIVRNELSPTFVEWVIR
jgi:hypothetical protein